MIPLNMYIYLIQEGKVDVKKLYLKFRSAIQKLRAVF